MTPYFSERIIMIKGIIRIRVKLVISYLMLVVALWIAVERPSLAQQPGRPRRAEPRKTEPRKTVPPGESPQSLSPREAFDRARSASSAKERIELLERVLATQRDTSMDTEIREALMREYSLRGEQHLREGNAQLAVRDFKSVLRVSPAVLSDRIFGQYIFPLPVAVNAFGFRVESAELMRSFEDKFQNDVNRLVQIGFFYVQIEAPLEAVRVLEQAVQLNPNDHRAHNSLGTAYLISLRMDEAVSQFKRSLELNPRDEYANLNLANLARATGDNERAAQYYRKQLEIKPDDAEAFGGRAIALLALGRNEEAEAAIKRATELAPADYRFLTQLAFFYTTRRKASLARPLIEQAARIEPRYAWTHITKANIDALEGKYGDALATLIQAQTLASFPTLSFELVKMLMALDGYDQALEVMGRAFTVSANGEFQTTLAGVVKARSQKLDLLLERERQASLYLNEHPTTSLQYRLAEALGRIDHYAKAATAGRKPNEAASRRRARPEQARPTGGAGDDQDLRTATRPRRAGGEATTASAELSAGRDAALPGMTELLRAINSFTTLDDGRQPFRMVWVSRKLSDTGVALDAAEQLARRAIAMAESATEPEGSMRDAPLLDREGRRAVFLGRAHDALGWALFKNGKTREALQHLSRAVQVYPDSPERKTVVWHLAVATQESGDERRALDLYIASYTAGTSTSSVRRAQIESLYKKLNGSLAGLEEKLRGQ